MPARTPQIPVCRSRRRCSSLVRCKSRGWTARFLGTLWFLMFLVVFIAEGSPPLPTQPGAVQIQFIALALMLAGVASGWWRDGLAALLLLGGWALFHVAEGYVPAWSLFHVAAVVGVLFALSWAGRWLATSHDGNRRLRLVTAAAIAGIPVLFAPLLNLASNRPAPRPVVTVSSPVTFGPVIERVIRAASNDCWALDLSSGDLVISTPEQPLDFRVGQADSLRSAKVDLYQPFEANTPDTVKALDIRLVALGAQAWDTPASEAVAHLEKEAAVQVRRSEVFLNGSAVYAFATRDGAKGVLQILKDTVPVMLRYKLLQPAATALASPREVVAEWLRRVKAGTSATPPLSSGVAVERVLDFDTRRKTAYLDLDTGEYVDPGPDNAFRTKATPAGVDLKSSAIENNSDVRWAINMAVVPVEPTRWEATAEEIRMAVGAVKRDPEIRLGGGRSTNTWFFQTSEGNRGILQFLPPKTGDDPSQVRLRYRLLQPAPSSGPSTVRPKAAT